MPRRPKYDNPEYPELGKLFRRCRALAPDLTLRKIEKIVNERRRAAGESPSTFNGNLCRFETRGKGFRLDLLREAVVVVLTAGERFRGQPEFDPFNRLRTLALRVLGGPLVVEDKDRSHLLPPRVEISRGPSVADFGDAPVVSRPQTVEDFIKIARNEERAGRWRQSAKYYELAAQQAEQEGDLQAWALWCTKSGQIWLYSGPCVTAERAFQAVLKMASMPDYHVDPKILAIVELRLSQLYGRQENSLLALEHLIKSIRQAPRELYRGDQTADFERILLTDIEGRKPWTYRAVTLHAAGRMLSEWCELCVSYGDDYPQSWNTLARSWLDRAAELLKSEHNLTNEGFSYLRQVPIEVREQNSTRAIRMLEESSERLDVPELGTRGYVHYERALTLIAKSEFRRGRRFLEAAQTEFSHEPLNPRGASLAHQRLSLLTNQTETTDESLKSAFQEALVAYCLFPYGKLLDLTLGNAAIRLQERLRGRFNAYWQDLQERINNRGDAPFFIIVQLQKHYTTQLGYGLLQEALEGAKRTVERALKYQRIERLPLSPVEAIQTLAELVEVRLM